MENPGKKDTGGFEDNELDKTKTDIAKRSPEGAETQVGEGLEGEKQEDEGEETAVKYIDVTDVFKKTLNTIHESEMLQPPDFSWEESMLSIELMDPKVDVGCNIAEKNVFQIEEALETELIPRPVDGDLSFLDSIAVMDLCLAMLSLWLSGQPLISSVYTILYLQDVFKVSHRYLNSFFRIYVKIISTMREFSIQASVTDEEDFLPMGHEYTLPEVEANFLTVVEVTVKTLQSELSILYSTDDKINEQEVGSNEDKKEGREEVEKGTDAELRIVEKPTRVEMECLLHRLQFCIAFYRVLEHFIETRGDNVKQGRAYVRESLDRLLDVIQTSPYASSSFTAKERIWSVYQPLTSIRLPSHSPPFTDLKPLTPPDVVVQLEKLREMVSDTDRVCQVVLWGSVNLVFTESSDEKKLAGQHENAVNQEAQSQLSAKKDVDGNGTGSTAPEGESKNSKKKKKKKKKNQNPNTGVEKIAENGAKSSTVESERSSSGLVPPAKNFDNLTKLYCVAEYANCGHSLILARSVLAISMLGAGQKKKSPAKFIENVLLDSMVRIVPAPLLYLKDGLVERYIEMVAEAVLDGLHVFCLNHARQRRRIGALFSRWANLEYEACHLDQTLFNNGYLPSASEFFLSWTLEQTMLLMSMFIERGFQLDLYSVDEAIMFYWYNATLQEHILRNRKWVMRQRLLIAEESRNNNAESAATVGLADRARRWLPEEKLEDSYIYSLSFMKLHISRAYESVFLALRLLGYVKGGHFKDIATPAAADASRHRDTPAGLCYSYRFSPFNCIPQPGPLTFGAFYASCLVGLCVPKQVFPDGRLCPP